jgi:hypothetical protein
VRNTDDPHDNAVINFDNEGNLFVMVSGRNTRRSAQLFLIEKPDQQRIFSADTLTIKDISPDNLNYQSLNIVQVDTPQFAPITYPNLLRTTSGLRLVFTLYCFGITEQCEQDTRQIWTAKLDYNSGDSQATLSSIRPLVAYQGHYFMARVADNGNDIAIAFNWHAHGKVDNRTNLYVLLSRDAGESWQYFDRQTQLIASAEAFLPITSFSELSQVAALELTQATENPTEYIYLKDLTWFDSGSQRTPVAMYLESTNPNAVAPDETNEYTSFVSYWENGNWHRQTLTIEQDHNFSSGALIKQGGGYYQTVYPGTPRYLSNALAGGAPARINFALGGEVQSPVYDAGSRVPGTNGYLRDLCEINYVKAVVGKVNEGFFAIAAAGNPYQFVSSTINPNKPNAPLLLTNSVGHWYQLPIDTLNTDDLGEMQLQALEHGNLLECGHGG